MKCNRLSALAILLALESIGASAQTAEPAPEPVKIRVDAAQPKGELTPYWRFFGADEPNYATMPHGEKLVRELGALAPDRVYFRAHNLLTSGDGTPALKWGSTGVYTEDAQGNPVYHWTILDAIFDTYRRNGVRPYVEIGFMPEALSAKPEPYRHQWTPKAKYDEIFTGWAYPPRDYQKWSDLVSAWTAHCVERYGRSEAEQWFWEVWNEPNIGYWRGTPEEFLKLHDYAIAGVKRALPGARVGGADSAGSGGNFTRNFLEHCLRGTNYATGKVGTPLDFVSFHAKGAPIYTNGHVRMGIATHLRTMEDGFRMIGSFPELKRKPIVIGESDPEGCAACQGPSLAYRNGTMYSSYTAASVAREYDLAEQCGVNLLGTLTWAFEFEEQPYFAGFRSLASNGIDKPVLNVFRMFSQMQGKRVETSSDHAVPLADMLRHGVREHADISALASLAPSEVCVMVWNYHDDDLPAPDAQVELSVRGLPPAPHSAKLEHFRIDAEHSNAFTAWQRMGSPQEPTPDQYSRLEAAGGLEELAAPRRVALDGGTAVVKFRLPRQAVSLLRLSW